MKRRNADCKLRRPIKRNKITDGMSSTTILYLKFLILWAIVITADFMFMVRFEFLWPFWMLLRSVHDSFKYKGLAFSVLFVCIAITSDLICLFFIPVNWLLFAASTYVWVQYVWHTDKGICLPTIILWMLFVYLEAGIRWKDSRHMPHLDLCRPFAAHCIGYPVVTLGFGFKSYVGYRMRQRKQREVAKENEFYMQLLQQALPLEENVNTTTNSNIHSNVTINNSLLNNSTSSSLNPSQEISIKVQNGCAGHQPKLPITTSMTSTTSNTSLITNSSKDEGSSTSISTLSLSTSPTSLSSSSAFITTSTSTTTSISMNSNNLLNSSNNNNNNSSSKSAAQNKINNVCSSNSNHSGNSSTVTSNGHVKNRRNNNNNNDKSNSNQVNGGKIYQQIKDLKETGSQSNNSSFSNSNSSKHYDNCNGSTNKKNQQINGSVIKSNHSSDYQVNEVTALPQPEKSKKKKFKKSDSNNANSHQNSKEKDNHHHQTQNNNSLHSKDLNSDASSISSSTSSSTSTLTNLSQVVTKICDACLKFEADIIKYKSEISQMKQIENDLRQKLDFSNQQMKNCLQAKQKECENLESRLQNIKSLRKTEQTNFTELERTLREEQRKRQSLEAQLQNEKIARSKAEEKVQMIHRMDCSDQCKQRRQQLDNEVKRLRRELKAAEEAKASAEQQNKKHEQKILMFEQEIRNREAQSGTKMLMAALNAMQDKNVNLEKNLSAETRVKLDLFSALGEAKRQIEIKNSLLYSRQEEVGELKAKIAELLAVLPSDNLCLPSTSNGPSSPLLNFNQQLLSGHQLNQRVNGDYLPPPPQPPKIQQTQQTSQTPTSSGDA